MEGIRDGFPVDTCYYCALLYPELDPCPKCDNRLRYEPAAMLNGEELQATLEQLQVAFGNDPQPDRALALLRFVHLNVDELGPDTLDLPQLRQVLAK